MRVLAPTSALQEQRHGLDLGQARLEQMSKEMLEMLHSKMLAELNRTKRRAITLDTALERWARGDDEGVSDDERKATDDESASDGERRPTDSNTAGLHGEHFGSSPCQQHPQAANNNSQESDDLSNLL